MSNPTASDIALWCKQTQADMGDVLGIPHKQVTNAHGIGNLLWHRLPYGGSKTRAEVKAIFQARQPIEPIPEPNILPSPDSWKNATGSYLYSGTNEENGQTSRWLAASQYVRWTRDQRRAYAQTQTGTHIVIAFNTGNRSKLGEQFFDGLATQVSRTQILQAIQDANEDGFQVWGYLATQEFLEQRFGLSQNSWDTISSNDFSKVVRHLQDTMELVKDVVHVVTPFREIGDKLSSDSLSERNQVMKGIRQVDNNVAIFCHERSEEGVPVSDFSGVSLPHGSALQTGFGVELQVAKDFMKDNVDRMATKLPGHKVHLFEMHIPPNVYDLSNSFQQNKTSTLSEAQAESAAVVSYSGAHGNMNAA